jgi:hypothetical protein
MASTLHCSFCRRSEHEVAKLAAGPGVFICDACVAEASRVMGEPARPGRVRALWARVRRRLVRRARGGRARRVAHA